MERERERAGLNKTQSDIRERNGIRIEKGSELKEKK